MQANIRNFLRYLIRENPYFSTYQTPLLALRKGDANFCRLVLASIVTGGLLYTLLAIVHGDITPLINKADSCCIEAHVRTLWASPTWHVVHSVCPTALFILSLLILHIYCNS